ncbi:hypothetical protein ACOJQI_02285 [Bacillus salacetis]|uniref:hypothetical protein n=1 Tax=Bacillus salacetis TaxID=2315464 RepID=UPI003B9DDAAB
MKKLTDFSSFQWILEETERVDFINWQGSFVYHFIPERFSHYCKIMHPIFRDLNVTDENLLWSDCDPDEEIDFNNSERLSFKDLAFKYDLKYTKEFSSHTICHLHGTRFPKCPRYLLFPSEGTMDEGTLRRMLPLLQSFTSGSCYFQYHLLAVRNYREDHGNGYLYHGGLKDVVGLCSSKDHPVSPTYWWDENREWCLYTDPDLDFTLFGGNKRMIDKLKGDSLLEVIEVDRETRVDHYADMENHPGIDHIK